MRRASHPLESTVRPLPRPDQFETIAVHDSRSAAQAVGSVERFATETASLVRQRLKAAALILAVALAAAFANSWFLAEQLLVPLRVVVLLGMIAAYGVLSSRIYLSLVGLRFFELAVFGPLVVQLTAMAWHSLDVYAAAGDGATVVAVRDAYVAAFSMLILLYGMLMPNSWRRAAAILFPLACVPHLLVLTSQWHNAQVALALSGDHYSSALPMSFVAAFAAVYATHTVSTIRRDAFVARQFGQYRLKDKLGAGGMGEVYRAEHVLLKRPCAIKLIKQDRSTDAVALARFEREVCSTARLTHWNSVEIFDYGHTEDGMFYYVMEYLEGMSLDALVKTHGPLPPERAVHFLRQTCGALREAHQLGLVHRDLKPANIFAARLGGVYDVAKLLDFGLVRHTEPDPRAANLTRTGGFSGSPLYMPPEQATNYHEVDGRGDLYSLGAVAYFLLTGHPPFVGQSAYEVLIAHARQAVKPPTQLGKAVPADLEAVVLKCLEKKPADRFADATSLERALAACQCAGKWSDAQAADWWHSLPSTEREAPRNSTRKSER